MKARENFHLILTTKEGHFTFQCIASMQVLKEECPSSLHLLILKYLRSLIIIHV